MEHRKIAITIITIIIFVSVYLRNDYLFRLGHLNSLQLKKSSNFNTLKCYETVKAITGRALGYIFNPSTKQYMLEEIKVSDDAIMNLGLGETCPNIAQIIFNSGKIDMNVRN